MAKIAIIGAGVVGASAAYYLKQYGQEDVTIFDDGHGQATKAAAGIICPWFSKRRNKAWYKMARLGADNYQELVTELKASGLDTSFYKQTGVILLKKNESRLGDLYDLAQKRQAESPLMGQLNIKTRQTLLGDFPGLKGFDQALVATGAARVDGGKLCQTLLAASGYPLVRKKVAVEPVSSGYAIDGNHFDQVILASGAWLPSLLEPLGYEVDVRPQKGQLVDYVFEQLDTDAYPVLMPEGEIDIIPFDGGTISVGASHENDKGYDLTPDLTVLNQLEHQASAYFPTIKTATHKAYRVGIRAYSSDFSPFYGEVTRLSGLFAASGLGSSGLTVGPLIGRELVCLLLQQTTLLDAQLYPIADYVIKVTGKK